MARRSPQEKKALSYARDCRNIYGENDKGSRKSIRRNKRIANRSDRHHSHQALASATGTVSPAAVTHAEIALQAKKSRRWRKRRDAPLGVVVVYTLTRRVERGMAESASAERRIERVRGCTVRAVERRGRRF